MATATTSGAGLGVFQPLVKRPFLEWRQTLESLEGCRV